MYKVNPRNLTLGPFLTLLFTLGRSRRVSASFSGHGTQGCGMVPADLANAHEGALQHCVVDHGEAAHYPLVLGPFLTLIFTLTHRGWRVDQGGHSDETVSRLSLPGMARR